MFSLVRLLNTFFQKSLFDGSAIGALLAKRVIAGVKGAVANDRQADLAPFSTAVDRSLINGFKQYEPELTHGSLASLPFVCYALRKSTLVTGPMDDQVRINKKERCFC